MTRDSFFLEENFFLNYKKNYFGSKIIGNGESENKKK